MILKFELLGLDDRRKSLDNSTHCLNEGVSVLNACYCLTWLDCSIVHCDWSWSTSCSIWHLIHCQHIHM